MSKEPRVYLQHIRDSIADIETYTNGVTMAEFLTYTNKEKQDAVVRKLEIIGEAARNIPDEFREKHAEIAWVEMIGMRNKLIHEYFGVDLELVWEVAKEDLPRLQEQIEAIL